MHFLNELIHKQISESEKNQKKESKKGIKKTNQKHESKKRRDEIMFEEIKKAIVDTLSCDEDKVVPEASLKDDLGADSLDAVELGMAIEEAVGVTIEDEDLPNIKTVQDLIDYVEAHK